MEHTGSCQCGAVEFKVRDLDLDQCMECNCSMCGRAGTILSFIGEDQFDLVSGEDVLKDYQFGKKHIHHTFCSVCGIKPFGSGADSDGNPTYAVNLRCVDGIEVSDLSPQMYDGRSL